jgi:nitrate reductase gamma subunit
MVSAATGLALLRGGLNATSPRLVATAVGDILGFLITTLGVIGIVLAVAGAMGLLLRRCTVRVIRQYTAPADIFNLSFFIVAFTMALVTCGTVDRDGTKAMRFAANLVTLELEPISGVGMEAVLPLVTVILLSMLVAYIPLTHMSHFVGKYFAYHAVRWNHHPSCQGSAQEATIQKLLESKVTWAAEHIGAQEGGTWVDVATKNPAQEGP